MRGRRISTREECWFRGQANRGPREAGSDSPPRHRWSSPPRFTPNLHVSSIPIIPLPLPLSPCPHQQASSGSRSLLPLLSMTSLTIDPQLLQYPPQRISQRLVLLPGPAQGDLDGNDHCTSSHPIHDMRLPTDSCAPPVVRLAVCSATSSRAPLVSSLAPIRERRRAPSSPVS